MDPKIAIQTMMIAWAVVMFFILCALLRFKKTKPNFYAAVEKFCAPMGGRRHLVLIVFLYLLPIAVPPHLLVAHLSIMGVCLLVASPLIIKWTCSTTSAKKRHHATSGVVAVDQIGQKTAEAATDLEKTAK